MSWRPSLSINAKSPVAETNLSPETWKQLYNELENIELEGGPLVDRLIEVATLIQRSGSVKAKSGDMNPILSSLQQWKGDPAQNAQPHVPEQLKSAIQQTLRDYFPAEGGSIRRRLQRRRPLKKTRKLRRRQRKHIASVHKKTKHRRASR